MPLGSRARSCMRDINARASGASASVVEQNAATYEITQSAAKIAAKLQR